MINNNFQQALKILAKKLNPNNIKWALIGSTNMAFQGIDIIPHDLDIVIQFEDLQEITPLFSEYNPSSINKLNPLNDKPAWEIKLKMNNVEVQILGEKDDGEYISKLLDDKITIKNLDNLKIPCFTLEAEAQTYEETHRPNKVRIIKEFLANK